MGFPFNSFSGGGGAVGNALVRMGVDASGVRGQVRDGFNDIKAEATAQGRAIEGQSRVWGTAFTALKATAVASFVGIGAAIGIGTAAAIEYESAFAGVIKTVDATEPQLAELRQGFRDLAKEIPLSATEFARLGEAAGALGIAREDIEEFARVTALIGVTTDVASDQAATSLGQLSNVLGLTSDDYERFGSTLVDLGNKGASTESQILEIASRAGGVGKQVGLSTPAILGFASAVANLGIEVEAGGTALQFLFQRISLLLADEEGLANLGKLAGTTGEAFKKAFLEDAQGAIISLLRGLSELDPVAQAVALDELGLAGARTSRAYVGLAASLDQNLLPALGVSNEAWEENNALQTEADKRFATTASQMQLLSNRIGDLFISLGDAILPTLNTIVTWLSEHIPKAAERLAEAWNETIGPAVGRLVDAIGGLVDAFLGIFGIEAEATDFGEVVSEAFDKISGAFAVLIDWAAKVIDIFAGIVGNDVVQQVLVFVAAWAGLRLAVEGTFRAARGLAGLGRGTLSALTFGTVGGNRAQTITGAATAAETAQESAANAGLSLAATELQAAAAALSAAARLMGAGGAGPLLPGGAPRPGQLGPITRPTALPVAPPLLLGPVADQAALSRTAAARAALASAAATGRSLVGSVAGAIAGGAQAVLGAGRGALGLASGALGLAAKAFWPAMVGLLVVDLVKAPIGQFVANELGAKNLGAEIQRDLFSGISTWLTSVIGGVDVEKIANLETTEFTAGGVTIDRVEAAKMGLSRTTMEEVFASEATLEGVIEQLTLADLVINPDQPLDLTIPERSAGDYQAQADKILERAQELGVDVQDIYVEAFGTGWQRAASTTPNPQILAKIVEAIEAASSERAGQTRQEFDENVREPVAAALIEQFGFTAAQAALLSDEQIEQAAVLLTRNTTGQYDTWFTGVLEEVAKDLEEHVPPAPPVEPFRGHGRVQRGSGDRGPSALDKEIAEAEAIMSSVIDFFNKGIGDAGEDAARQAASDWLETYSASIASAETDEERQAIIKKLGADSWEQVLAAEREFPGDERAGSDTRPGHAVCRHSDSDGRAGRQLRADPGGLVDRGHAARGAGERGAHASGGGADQRDFSATLRSSVVAERSPRRRELAASSTRTSRVESMTTRRSTRRSRTAPRTRAPGALAPRRCSATPAQRSRSGSQMVRRSTRTSSATPWLAWSATSRCRSRPSSGARSKHPFLPNAGRKIVQQINEGLLAEKIAFPSMDMPNLASLGALPAGAAGMAGGAGGRSRTQHIQIDRMYGRTDRDEQAAVAQLDFLMPED